MKVSKPIEIEMPTYILRLEGSILTITPIAIHTDAGHGPTTRTLCDPVQRMASFGLDSADKHPEAIIADLMRELAK